MHSFLKQSTASQSRSLGPFLDDTDFKTAETALTIANTDIKLMINGAASANKNSGGGTHRANGVYGVTFDATDTATVGEMVVSGGVAGALPVFATFVVLEEVVYDALFGASAIGYVANQPVDLNTIKTQTVTCSGGVTVPAATLASTTNITAGTITTVTNLTNAPTAGDFTATMKTSIGTAVAASAVASVTGNVGGNVTGSVGSVATGGITAASFAADAITAAKVAADVGTEIGTAVWATAARTLTAGTNLNDLSAAGVRAAVGLASANLDTQLSNIDTVADSIKAKTDSLTFTTAGMVDSAVKRVGTTTLAASGTGGQGYGA